MTSLEFDAQKALSLVESAIEDVPDSVRNARIRDFQRVVWSTEVFSDFPDLDDLMMTLAYDLDFYVSDPKRRAEDSSYYGNNRLVEVISEGVARAPKLLKEAKPL